jgi:undecaprenyl-diphosphatase
MAEKKHPVEAESKLEQKVQEPVQAAVEEAREQVAEATEQVADKKRTLDLRIFRLINSIPHARRDDLVVSVISDLGQGMGWWAASAWLAATGGRSGLRAGLATTAASVGATYLVQAGIKPVFRRNRPFTSREAIVVGIGPSDHSFPSGHSAASFAAAHALAHFYPKQRIPLYTVASLVGLSRIRVGHHFPSDVAVGAAIGLGIGELCYRLANWGSQGR